MAVLIYPSLQQPVLFTDVPSEQARWFKQWADPVDMRAVQARSFVARMESFFYDTEQLGTPEFIGPDKWWQPFSERLHAKPGLAVYLQQALAYSESAQFPEVVFIDKYLYPFGEPKRFPKELITAAHPYQAFVDWTSAGDSPSAWYPALSEPKRFKPRLDTGLNPYAVTGAHALGTPYARGYVIC